MKITASNSTTFSKIEEELNKIDKEFAKKFTSAEYVLDGYSDIKLTTDFQFDNKIILPIKFIINSIKFEDYVVIDKNSVGEIRETQKYQIEIEGKIEEQKYRLVYTNLYKINNEICYR